MSLRSTPIFRQSLRLVDRRAAPIVASWTTSSAPSRNQSTGSRPPKPIDDSTSALDYKLTSKRRAPPALPAFSHPRAPSAEEAVTNILYNTPAPSSEPFKKHTLNCLVQNEPGVLSRVSGILAARGFNIDSLVVCQTEIRDLSRMCIVLRGQDGVIEQARRQLEDLVPVWAVLDYTRTSCISRELLLCKVSILGPEYAEQQMSGGPTHAAEAGSPVAPFVTADGQTHHTDLAEVKLERERALAQNFEKAGSSLPGNLSSYASAGHHNPLSASEALIAKNLHLRSVKTLAEQFGGRVVDVAENSVIIELTAKSTRVDAFLSLMRPFGVLEAVRSGLMVLPRTPIARSPYDDDEISEAVSIDASLLPPG
ncbi:hypothetical protein QFC22_002296 [Naganishia vaughanmartiniae]|uniref:Uncharacterized protein n=1 Tax=Naganishia vaughanmartiniae TaxID=1424756 RepID=A0ACC2XF70_9TREE|nr:hypothetical protein QFC22_002296 [Naganishia vaughanmartiniae]